MELIPMKVLLDVGEMAHFACAYFSAERLHIDMEISGQEPILIDGIVATDNITDSVSDAVSSPRETQLGPPVRDTLNRFPWGGRRILSVLVGRPVDLRRVTCRVTNAQGLVMGQLTAPLIQLSSPGSFKNPKIKEHSKKTERKKQINSSQNVVICSRFINIAIQWSGWILQIWNNLKIALKLLKSLHFLAGVLSSTNSFLKSVLWWKLSSKNLSKSPQKYKIDESAKKQCARTDQTSLNLLLTLINQSIWSGSSSSASMSTSFIFSAPKSKSAASASITSNARPKFCVYQCTLASGFWWIYRGPLIYLSSVFIRFHVHCCICQCFTLNTNIHSESK